MFTLTLKLMTSSDRLMNPIKKRLVRQVVFAKELGKWNYLVKPTI